MTYLLDTDVIVNYFRKKDAQYEAKFVKSSITYFTLTELIYGAHLSNHNTKAEIELIKQFLEDFQIGYVPFDERVVLQFAETKHKLEEKGKKLEDFDLFIAATAIVNNLTLVTHNKRHFMRIKELKLL